tara:strand:+ start:691 stop:936 length:246 start_codon:yes stop_codon:yes gene_type:complete
MPGFMDAVRSSNTFAEFKRQAPGVKITEAGFIKLKKQDAPAAYRAGRTSSKRMRDTVREMTPPEDFLKRNDGGIARKTRTF